MITVWVTRSQQSITGLHVVGHGDGDTVLGRRVCASVSGCVAMLRELIGGSPLDAERGGSYSVRVARDLHRVWVAAAFVCTMGQLAQEVPQHLMVREILL